MKRKTLGLTLLVMASGLLIASCDKPANSSEPDEESSSVVEEVEPTRVKISQPGIVVVGDTIKVSDICTFTPAEATKYVVESGDTSIATVTDNEIITIVAAGKTTCKIKTASGSVLGTININAMTKTGKALQEWSDSLTTNYLLDASWGWYSNNSWSKVTESDTISGTDAIGLLVTENYVVDGTYGPYSAITLEKAEGSCYGFTLLNGSSEEIDYSLGFTNALKSAASVEIGERCSSAYIDSYFVYDGLLNVIEWNETVVDGKSVFSAINGSTVVDLLGSLFGMVTDSYTGVGGEIEFDVENKVLSGDLRFNDSKDANICSFTLSACQGIDVLDDAVKNAEPPAPVDVSTLVDTFAKFDKNYTVDWVCGAWTSSGRFDTTKENAVGVTVWADNLLVNIATSRLEDGNIDYEAELDLTGYYADETGIYAVEFDENLVTSKGELISDKYFSIADLGVNLADIPEAVISGASLALDDSYAEWGIYSFGYNPAFDSMALFGYLENTSWYNYGFSNEDPEVYKNYCEGGIEVYGDELCIFAQCRVRFSDDTTGTQGIISYPSNPGEVNLKLGDSCADVFADYLPPVTEDFPVGN